MRKCEIAGQARNDGDVAKDSSLALRMTSAGLPLLGGVASRVRGSASSLLRYDRFAVCVRNDELGAVPGSKRRWYYPNPVPLSMWL